MAGSKSIKGITIEIGGNTTKLSKALSDASGESVNLQKELKTVNKLLELDPTNTELLAQKQQILKESIQETANKLDVLKEAEKQVQAQFEKGEVSEQQYRELQREIITTEQKLNDLKATAESAGDSMENAGEDAGKLADNLEVAQQKADKAAEMGKTAAAGVAAIGTAAVGAGVAAVKFDADYDAALNNVITQTGATKEETESLETAMRNIYNNNFGEDLYDIANAMATVKPQPGASGKEVEKTTQNALLLRDTFGMEVEESVRAANSLMKQFGISADEAYNLMAQGAQSGLNANQDMCDVINEYSVQYANAGLSAEEMFNMLVSGAEQGTWSIDKLGDAFKEFNIRMNDGTANEYLTSLGLNADEVVAKFQQGGDSAKEAMQQISDALKNCDDETVQYTAGVGIMGTMYEDMGLDACTALLQTQGEISKTKDALAEINNQKYNDINSQIEELGRNIQTEVVQPLGDELAPVAEEVIDEVKSNLPQIKDILSDVLSIVGELIGFFMQNGNTVIAIIGGIAAGMLAWNVVNMIQGIISVMELWRMATLGNAAAQAALNKTLLGNPIALIVAAIAGIIAAIVLLYNNCEWFREMVNGIFEAIKNFVGTAVEVVGGFISSVWEKIQEIWAFIQPYIEMIWAFIQQILADIAQIFSDTWEIIKAIWDLVQPYFLMLWEGIKAIFAPVIEVLGGLFSAAWEAIKLVWDVVVMYFSTIWENIKIVFSVVATVLGSFFSNAWTAIKAVWDVVASYFAAVWNAIKTIFSVVKDVLTGNFRGAWEGIKSIWSGFANFFQTAWNSVKTIFSSVGNFFRTAFSSAWNAVQNVFANWGSFFSGLWNRISSTFSSIGTRISGAISGAVRSGINGVISSIQSIINSGIGLINGAIGLINKIPGVSIGRLGYLSLPRLAHGGILQEGDAMVAEAGPELIRMVNGKAIVTPLTPTAKNTAMEAAGGKATKNITNAIEMKIENFYNNREQDIRELTEEILEIAEEIKEREEAAYA